MACKLATCWAGDVSCTCNVGCVALEQSCWLSIALCGGLIVTLHDVHESNADAFVTIHMHTGCRALPSFILMPCNQLHTALCDWLLFLLAGPLASIYHNRVGHCHIDLLRGKMAGTVWLYGHWNNHHGCLEAGKVPLLSWPLAKQARENTLPSDQRGWPLQGYIWQAEVCNQSQLRGNVQHKN